MKYCFTLLLLAATQLLSAQQFTRDKNFYLVKALEQYPALVTALPPATVRDQAVAAYRFSDASVQELDSLLAKVYDQQQALADELLDKQIRPSGNYALYLQSGNRELWLKIWRHYFTGINYIIDQYGLGKKMRYPAIDSASYHVSGDAYQQLLKGMFVKLQPSLSTAKTFYENPLQVALALMELNHRDEPARHEPLERGENKDAFRKVRKIDFNDYTYSALVVPGDGPTVRDIPLAPASIERCHLVAEKFKQKKAPLIILTGGYCHPFQTQFSEAVEMKKYLVSKLKVPAAVIIIDPHARHTTTNFRNACRYIIRYGLPEDKLALMVTSKAQADYIMDPRFDGRNKNELGYLPYREKTRLDVNEISFYPVPEALHRDNTDPLDP